MILQKNKKKFSNHWVSDMRNFFGVYQKSISWKCEGYTPNSVDLMIYKTNGDLIRFYVVGVTIHQQK